MTPQSLSASVTSGFVSCNTLIKAKKAAMLAAFFALMTSAVVVVALLSRVEDKTKQVGLYKGFDIA